MSRKSPAPMLDGEFIIECSHLKGRKYVPDHHGSHASLGQGGGGRVRNGSESNIHRMTSFEELAKNKGTSGSNSSLLKHVNDDYIIRQMVRARGNRLTKSEIYETVDSSESGSNDRYEIYASINSQKISRGHKSDYNIQYKNLSTRGPTGDSVGGHEYNSIEYKTFKTRQSSRESGNDSSPFDYDLLPDGRHENSALRDYNRFFNNEDDDEDKLLNKSSDESSTSPPPHRQVQYVQKTSPMTSSPNAESVPLLTSPNSRKTSVPSSSIPVSNSMKRNKKHSSDHGSFRLELSSPHTSSNRRNPPESTSRIPVIKSPTSPTSSLQGSLRQPNRSRIPTSHVTNGNSSRIPAPPFSPGGTSSSMGRRIGTSSSAHQIQGAGVAAADSNKIRIKVNQSQSYSSG